MNFLLILFLTSFFVFTSSSSSSKVDCNFDPPEKGFCKWRRERFGTRKAAWKKGKKIRNFLLKDTAPADGKFAYVISRSRPVGFRSRLRSPTTFPNAGSCLNFRFSIGGSKFPFPEGNPALRAYAVGEGKQVDPESLIWSKSGDVKKPLKFEGVSIPLDELTQKRNNSRVQFVIEVVRGASRKSYVAIDDVILKSCAETGGTEPVVDELDINVEAEMKKEDVEAKLLTLMLPARRSRVETIKFHDFEISSVPVNQIQNPPQNVDNSSRAVGGEQIAKTAHFRRRGRNRERNRNRRINRKRNKGGHRSRVGKIAFDFDGAAGHGTRHSSLSVMCDFILYTQKLRRCFREFFSELRRRPKSCKKKYSVLETCLRSSATSCVQTRDLSPTRLDEIVIESLRESLRVKEVFCKEEGAFVFPQFPMDKLPIQCGPRYFIKLSECSGSFHTMFHNKNGSPQLCRVYYKANECQRKTTAEECNFDLQTMLLYGLYLQYQIAYNPFCLNLPFSSWWPDT